MFSVPTVVADAEMVDNMPVDQTTGEVMEGNANAE